MSLDIDGSLLNFPYVGIESLAANLSHLEDVLGARLYIRPLVETSIPIVKNLQIGATGVVDLDPFYHVVDKSGDDGTSQVLLYGGDAILPILSTGIISLSAFGDYVMQTDLEDSSTSGAMVGVGGRIIGLITYGAQLRYLGDNFVPTYFGPTYDLDRVKRYEEASAAVDSGNMSLGWYGSAGVALLDDQIVFSAGLDGPFGEVTTDPDSLLNDMHLRATLNVAEGLLPGIFFDALYDKQGIDSFSSLGSFEEALIAANIHYKTGPAVITLSYDVKKLPEGGWETNASLMSSISLF